MTVCVQMVKVIWRVECVSVKKDFLVQSVNAQRGELARKFSYMYISICRPFKKDILYYSD
jgi:hypothetical protein